MTTAFFAFFASLSLSLSRDSTESRLSTLEFLVRLRGTSGFVGFFTGFFVGLDFACCAALLLLLGFSFDFWGSSFGGEGDFFDLE